MTSAASTVLASAGTALAAHDYELAIDLLVDGGAELRGDTRAELRAHLDESWARMSMGDLDSAIVKLERARALAEAPVCDDTDRAEVLYQLGCCRLKSGAVSNAIQLLTVSLRLCEESPTLSDRLRVDILCWRTRCYRRQRDWDAARADADAAIQLGEELKDAARLADAYLQASQIAERTGQLLIARFYVERVIELQRDAGDLLSAGKALNNLGGILFLLGETDAANTSLKEAFAVALELGNEVDAAYAVSSTAQVLLRGGETVLAEEKARYALELLEDREDHVNEVGNARLVLGRALMEQGRFDEAADELAVADASFEQMDSLGHRAAAWLAQGDLSARRGHIEDAPLERIRELTDVPVLMVTARSGELEKVRGLKAGADDYMTKPFGRQELLARVEALLRRKRLAEDELPTVYADDAITVEFAQRSAQAGGVDLKLTPLEFRLLSAFVKHPNQVLSREQLLELAWGDPYGVSEDQVKLYVGYLRKKLGTDGGAEGPIETVRGFGYRYRPVRAS